MTRTPSSRQPVPDDLTPRPYPRESTDRYHTLGYSPRGFRTCWRRLHGDDEQLDNAHLMRLAGRFGRRVRASAAAHGIPVIDCKRRERKHEIAKEYLATHPVDRGVFLILVARAIAPVWEVLESWALGRAVSAISVAG